jgi:phosphatidylglycerophosphate synthase
MMSEKNQIHREAYNAVLGKRLGGAFATLLDFMAKRLSVFHPNTITIISFGFAVASAICIFAGDIFLLLAALSLFLNILFDFVDGIVARRKNQVSKRGAFLDLVVDRFSDILVFVGISMGPYANPYLGMISLSTILVVAYLRLYKMSISPGRKYGYSILFGRVGMLSSLILVCVAQYILILLEVGSFHISSIHISLFEIWLFVIAFASILSAVSVFQSTWKELGNRR